MKNVKFFVMALLCLYISLQSVAQSETDSLNYNPDYTYTQNMDSLFANISKQYITTGIFYNRVAPMANLHLISNNSIVSPAYFWQAYHELYTASYQHNTMQDLTQAQLLDAYYKQQDTLTIGVINSNFTMLRDSMRPTDDMIVIKNGRMYDGANIANAFVHKQVTFATLLTDNIEPGKKYNLKLSAILLENNSNKVKNIIVTYKNTRDGIAVKLDDYAPLTFPTVGEYELEIGVVLADGKLYNYKQGLKVGGSNAKRLPSSFTNTACNSVPYLPTLPNASTTASTIRAEIPFPAINGIRGEAIVRVFFRKNGSAVNAPCFTNIAKPIILLDGIDDQNQHSALWIYDEKLIYANPNPVSATDSFRQIGDSLRQLGYDLIFFNPSIQNFPPIAPATVGTLLDGGDDLIQRNAMTLVRLIQDVNNNLAQQGISEKVVVCGPSMGGQVSRFALRFMEQQLAATSLPIWDHKCRLWVSLDSPHEGANIPIGLQQYIKQLAQLTTSAAAFATYTGNLCAPASRQQLIHQTDHDSTSPICNVFFNNTAPERIAWRNTLAAIGYPINLRKIALSNGSSLGGYHKTPGTNMLGLQLGNTDLLRINFMSRFLPTTGNTYKSFEVSKTFLSSIHFNWFPNWYTPLQLDPVIHNESITDCNITNNSVFGAIDGCPGSYYDVQTVIRNSITDGISSGILSAVNSGSASINNTINNVLNIITNSPVSWNTSLLSPVTLAGISNFGSLLAFSQLHFPDATKNISFIPTVSSLGVLNSNFDWALPLPSKLVCNNRTPFDNYYVPTVNEEHVSFSQDSWRWLKEELQRGHNGNDCISICGVDQINGKDFLCRNTSSLYSLNAIIGTGSASGNVTIWSASPGFSIVPTAGNANQSATVTASSTATNGWIKAIITNPCGSEKIEIIKIINSGVIYPYTLSFKKVCTGCCEYEAKVSNINTNALLGSKFQWSIDGLNYTSITSPYFNLPNYGSYIGGINNLPANSPTVYVKITPPCGSSIILLTSTFTVATPPAAGCSWKKEIDITPTEFKGQEVSVFPNPTNDVWNLEIPNYSNKKVKVSLYNMSGKELLHNEFSNLPSGIIELSAKDLPSNIYLLKVIIDDKVFHLKLSKQ